MIMGVSLYALLKILWYVFPLLVTLLLFFTSAGFLQLSQKVVRLQNIKERKDIGQELDMETNFITIYFFCLQARMVNFVTLLRNGVTFSKEKIYDGFYVIKFIFEIADTTMCI